jgi:hypothetical protein
LLFDCFAIVVFVAPIVLAAPRHLPRAHVFFNDFKQLGASLAQPAAFVAIVFSLLFTIALLSLAAPQRCGSAHPASVLRPPSSESATICKLSSPSGAPSGLRAPAACASMSS